MKNKMFLIKTVLTCCIALFIAYMLINVEPFSNVDIKEVENQIVTTGDLGTMKKSNNMMIKKVLASTMQNMMVPFIIKAKVQWMLQNF